MQRRGRTHGQRSSFDRRCIRRVRVRFVDFFSWTSPYLYFVIVFKCYVLSEKAVLSPIFTTGFLPVTVEQDSRKDRRDQSAKLTCLAHTSFLAFRLSGFMTADAQVRSRM